MTKEKEIYDKYNEVGSFSKTAKIFNMPKSTV